jgi:Flp pilus assembly protein TadD
MRHATLLLLLGLAACGGQSPRPAVVETPAPKLASWQPTLHLAETALATGAPEIALRVTDELLARDPRDVAALDRRGDALVALGRPREAEVAFGTARGLRPDDAGAGIGLGRLRMAQDPAAAEQMFAAVAVANPHDGAALCDLGVARDLQGHHAQAQDAYRQALAAEPTSAAVQVNLGLSLALSGRSAEAVKLLRPLAAEPAATPRVRQDLALALALDGSREEATTLLAQDMPPDQARDAVSGFQALAR